MGRLAETAAATGATAHAATLCRLLAPYEDRIAISYPEIATGAVARGLGLLATALGRLDAADGHFTRAIEINENAGARPWLALAEDERAVRLSARRSRGSGPA
jgi:hypothetical protein